MLSWMTSAIIGIASVSLFPSLPSKPLAALFILLMLFCFSRHQHVRLLGALLVGINWGLLSGYLLLSSQLPDQWQGKELWVDGRVVGLPSNYQQRGQRVDRFELKVDQLCLENICKKTIKKIRLSWYGAPLSIEPGQQWHLKVKLKLPWGMSNLGSFDYQTWLITQGVGGVGYVRGDENNQLITSFQFDIDRWRWQIAAQLQHRLSNYQYVPIIKTLLIGDKRDITKQQWDLFNTTGTTHLMVISGLHVGLIAVMAFYIGRYTCLFFSLSFSPERWGALFACFVAFSYALMAGFSLPTQRALIMITVWMVSIYFHRHLSVISGLLIALFICLVFDPLAVVTTSFWLSFGAVTVLLYGTVGRKTYNHQSRIGRYNHTLVSQYSIFIGLLPILAVSIKQLSLLSPLANIVLIPLFSLLIVPLNFLALIISLFNWQVAKTVWWLLDKLLNISAEYLSFLKELDVGLVYVSNLPPVVIFLSVVGVLVMLLPKGTPLKYSGLLLLAPIVLYKPLTPKEGDFYLTVLDVGQGLSIVVETENHALVYDLGPAIGDRFNTAEGVVLPYLRAKGIERIDRLIVSHNDNDHAGAWDKFINHIFVSMFIYGEHDNRYPASSMPCHKGDAWTWDGIDFKFLYPNGKPIANSSNNHSCVLRITSVNAAGNISVLLTGDIERSVEKVLISDSESLSADILIAPHHGSKTSSSSEFVKAVNPGHVVFASGYRNRFRHPRPEIIERYQNVEAILHYTAINGAVEFSIVDGSLDAVNHYRDSKRRYWLPVLSSM